MAETVFTIMMNINLLMFIAIITVGIAQNEIDDVIRNVTHRHVEKDHGIITKTQDIAFKKADGSVDSRTIFEIEYERESPFEFWKRNYTRIENRQIIERDHKLRSVANYVRTKANGNSVSHYRSITYRNDHSQLVHYNYLRSDGYNTLNDSTIVEIAVNGSETTENFFTVSTPRRTFFQFSATYPNGTTVNRNVTIVYPESGFVPVIRLITTLAKGFGSWLANSL